MMAPEAAKTPKPYRRALVVSTTALVGGIAASLAGNLQAINLHGAPGVGATISAVIWPVFLFAAIEVMLHTPWIRSWRDGLTKWAALLAVAFTAFWISYWHMQHVLQAYGYDAVSSHVGPLAIDVLMMAATLSLNRVGQSRRMATGQLDIVAISKKASTMSGLMSTWTMDDDLAVQDMSSASIWDRLDTVLDDSTTPAMPVDIRPLSPAGPAAPRVSPERVPDTAVAMLQAWTDADPTVRPSLGQVDALIAADHGVATRTARGWRTALGMTRTGI